RAGSSASGVATRASARPENSRRAISASQTLAIALPDQRQDGFIQEFWGYRTGMLVQDGAVCINQERFGYPVNTKINAHMAIGIVEGLGIRVAKALQPPLRVVALVLVVQSVDGDGTTACQVGEHLMLLPAGAAPRCPDIQQPDLIFQTGGRQGLRRIGDTGERELWRLFANQG